METEVSEKTNVRNMSILRGTHLLVLNKRHQVHTTQILLRISAYLTACCEILIEIIHDDYKQIYNRSCETRIPAFVSRFLALHCHATFPRMLYQIF
jgi:hypothetical protein